MKLPTKCPTCQSTKMTQNEKGEIACGNCPYTWKPNSLKNKEVKMKTDITKASDVPTGKKFEMTPEQKAKLIAQDKKLLFSYNIQIEQFDLEIYKLSTAIKANLPMREVKAQLVDITEARDKFVILRKIIIGRNKEEDLKDE